MIKIIINTLHKYRNFKHIYLILYFNFHSNIMMNTFMIDLLSPVKQDLMKTRTETRTTQRTYRVANSYIDNDD